MQAPQRALVEACLLGAGATVGALVGAPRGLPVGQAALLGGTYWLPLASTLVP